MQWNLYSTEIWVDKSKDMTDDDNVLLSVFHASLNFNSQLYALISAQGNVQEADLVQPVIDCLDVVTTYIDNILKSLAGSTWRYDNETITAIYKPISRSILI